MKVYDAATIRNVAVVGHGGCGKTQLVSALLTAGGAVARLGRVDDGTTVTDHDDEEIARRHTLSAALAHVEWRGIKINLIDTPGFGHFFSEARAALRVADAALIVVDAVAGVEVQTEKAWEAAADLDLPRLIVVSRLDRDRASLDRTLASLRQAFGRSVAPVQLPLGEGADFTGVVDLLARATSSIGDGGRASVGTVPLRLDEAATAARDGVVELVAEANESLIDTFFETGTLADEQLRPGLSEAVAASAMFPVLCASGLTMAGVHALLDALVEWVPSPAHRPFTATDASGLVARHPADDHAPCAAFVWKTVADQFAGRLTLFRVYQGTVKADSTLFNHTQGTAERLGHLGVLQGKTQIPVPELRAGDLGVVAKLKDTRTNDLLADRHGALTFAPIVFPEPVLSYAIEPKTRGDEDKISGAMHRLEEEDPTLRYTRDPQTHELLLSGQGQLHIEVAVARLKRRFGVDVHLKPPRIPYRETITARVEAHGRHKKQTGGHGQFGDCKIRVAPLARGAGFEFADAIFGGAIPRQFVPAVEKGIQESRLRGFLAGYPVVDFRVELFDGQYHDVDSNELSFKTAGSLAFKDAMGRARPTLLEPIMQVEIHTPSDHAGNLMGDLNGRRGRISGMEPRGATTVIKAQVPMAEMLSYEQHLTSATGGRGSYQMEFSQYDEVPLHLQQRIVSAYAERGHPVQEEV